MKASGEEFSKQSIFELWFKEFGFQEGGEFSLYSCLEEVDLSELAAHELQMTGEECLAALCLVPLPSEAKSGTMKSAPWHVDLSVGSGSSVPSAASRCRKPGSRRACLEVREHQEMRQHMEQHQDHRALWVEEAVPCLRRVFKALLRWRLRSSRCAKQEGCRASSLVSCQPAFHRRSICARDIPVDGWLSGTIQGAGARKNESCIEGPSRS